ncbi:hypothetical protein [Virgibacillus dokdonensis]|uniref:hypothetical protein n=1 Tax=Virgibacillus dokdonensis TaxID=302167 RepID=UPI00098BA203|nr:hypothetical protein [Virgibacillus dokdonensis]
MICSNCGNGILQSRYYRAGKNGSVFCSKDCAHEAYEGFYSKQEVSKTMECHVLENKEKEVVSMENKNHKIMDQATEIKASLEIMDGQMSFFGELIDDTQQHPEAAALL